MLLRECWQYFLAVRQTCQSNFWTLGTHHVKYRHLLGEMKALFLHLVNLNRYKMADMSYFHLTIFTSMARHVYNPWCSPQHYWDSVTTWMPFYVTNKQHNTKICITIYCIMYFISLTWPSSISASPLALLKGSVPGLPHLKPLSQWLFRVSVIWTGKRSYSLSLSQWEVSPAN